MNENLPLILISVALLLIALWSWARRRAAVRARRQRLAPPGTGEANAPSAPGAATWAPPRYETAREAAAGPSLRVGINIVSLQADALLVTWNATNNGSVPVAVQWGAPQVVVEADVLQLRYTHEAAAPFAPRVCQPGEILSRSASVARDAAGRDLGGLRVTVAVGYGDAAAYETAWASEGIYLAWQQVAVSPPRIVPRR